MSSGSTWSLKGIDNQTREAVKAAARKSGLTLGEWFNDFIQEAVADSRGRGVLSAKSAKSKSKSKKKALRKKHLENVNIDELLTRLESTSVKGQHDAVATIGQRLAASEQHALEAVRSATITAVYSRLGNFDERVSSAQEDKIRVISRASEANFEAIENTLEKIVVRLEASEEQNRQTAKTMQNYMSQLDGNAAPAKSGQAESDAAEMLNLEERVSHLAKRLGAHKS